jgi:thioredoxin 1
MKSITIHDETFEQDVIQSNVLTLVDFWAPWCGPCRSIAPALDDIAARYDGRLKVTKLDVDANPATSKIFGISSIPTLLFFKHGTIVGQVIGAVPASELETRINAMLTEPDSVVREE